MHVNVGPLQISMKHLSLVLLVVQNAGVVIVMKYASGGVPKAYSTTIVVMQELLKLFFSLLLVYREADYAWDSFAEKCTQIFDPGENLRMLVPSVLYAIQNNLILFGVASLPAAIFHVTYQCKLLSTALLSVLILGRTLRAQQWLALLVLTLGMAAVQMSRATHHTRDEEKSQFFGIMAVAGACLCSGFAGVYFEKVLKNRSNVTANEVSVWGRNVQLATGGVLVGALICFFNEGPGVQQNGFFYGYSNSVWCVVCLNGAGGLIIAMVIKYADNILKGFATALAIVLSSVLSTILFGFVVNSLFVGGAAGVIVSVLLFGWPVAPSVEIEPGQGESDKGDDDDDDEADVEMALLAEKDKEAK